MLKNERAWMNAGFLKHISVLFSKLEILSYMVLTKTKFVFFSKLEILIYKDFN